MRAPKVWGHVPPNMFEQSLTLVNPQFLCSAPIHTRGYSVLQSSRTIAQSIASNADIAGLPFSVADPENLKLAGGGTAEDHVGYDAVPSFRPIKTAHTERGMVKTATGQNGDKSKRRQVKTATSQNGDKPKRLQVQSKRINLLSSTMDLFSVLLTKFQWIKICSLQYSH